VDVKCPYRITLSDEDVIEKIYNYYLNVKKDKMGATWDDVIRKLLKMEDD